MRLPQNCQVQGPRQDSLGFPVLWGQKPPALASGVSEAPQIQLHPKLGPSEHWQQMQWPPGPWTLQWERQPKMWWWQVVKDQNSNQKRMLWVAPTKMLQTLLPLRGHSQQNPFLWHAPPLWWNRKISEPLRDALSAKKSLLKLSLSVGPFPTPPTSELYLWWIFRGVLIGGSLDMQNACTLTTPNSGPRKRRSPADQARMLDGGASQQSREHTRWRRKRQRGAEGKKRQRRTEKKEPRASAADNLSFKVCSFATRSFLEPNTNKCEPINAKSNWRNGGPKIHMMQAVWNKLMYIQNSQKIEMKNNYDCIREKLKSKISMKLDHVYTVATFKYTGLFNIRTGLLDYLREGFPWPFKHTESNSFKPTGSNSLTHGNYL